MNEISKFGITMEQAENIINNMMTPGAFEAFRDVYMRNKTFGMIEGQKVVYYRDFHNFFVSVAANCLAGVAIIQVQINHF